MVDQEKAAGCGSHGNSDQMAGGGQTVRHDPQGLLHGNRPRPRILFHTGPFDMGRAGRQRPASRRNNVAGEIHRHGPGPTRAQIQANGQVLPIRHVTIVNLFQYFQMVTQPYQRQGDKPMREPTFLTASTPAGSASSAILGTTVFCIHGRFPSGNSWLVLATKVCLKLDFACSC